MDPVQNHGAIERQTWLGAVPRHEVGYGTIVGTLAALRGKAVQDSGLGLFEVRKG
jgi:hypothetical protein